MVYLQSVPGVEILYGSMVKKKWVVNSAFMALYAFAVVLICWVLLAYHMPFGRSMGPLLSKPGVALSQDFLLSQSKWGRVPIADHVFYQFEFVSIIIIVLIGSLLGRTNFYAWMLFVPSWLLLSYTIGAFVIWGGGFLKESIIDYAGGFTTAYWVGPRHSHDRQHFPPNNIIHMLGGAGFLWLGWTDFKGGSPFSVLNTHLCTATSILVWVSLDMLVYKKSSVIGAVQGVITGLVCITSGAGAVDPWAALLMGLASGSVPWYTMVILHRRSVFFQSVDDTLAVFHTHAVAGVLGAILSGVYVKPVLLGLMYPTTTFHRGLIYSIAHGEKKDGLKQMGCQIAGAVFNTTWNAVVTSLIWILISRIVDLRMNEDDLDIGDDAVPGEEGYALWGDGGKMPNHFA